MDDTKQKITENTDYLELEEYSKFAKHEPHFENSFQYRMVGHKSDKQLVIEKTVLNKKLARAGRLILAGLVGIIFSKYFPSYLVQQGINAPALQTLNTIVKGLGGGTTIFGAISLAKSLDQPITVGDINKYKDDIDKKLQKYRDKYGPFEEEKEEKIMR